MTDIFKDGLLRETWHGEYERILTPSEVQQLFDAFISRCYQPQLFQKLDCVGTDGDRGKTDDGR